LSQATARLYDAATGRPLGKVMTLPSPITAAVIRPGGKSVLLAGKDGTAGLWDAAGEPVGELLRTSGQIFRAYFTADGRSAVVVGEKIVTVAADTGRLLPGEQPSRNYSPDRKTYLVSTLNMVQAFDAASGKPAGLPLKHNGRVDSAVFSPDGKAILTTS